MFEPSLASERDASPVCARARGETLEDVPRACARAQRDARVIRPIAAERATHTRQVAEIQRERRAR